MRVTKYLSPSSIMEWGASGDREARSEFYLKRLADNRPPRLAQTEPMSVGSAFDAYVKCQLHNDLFGHDADGLYDTESLLTTQVEPHNLDFARVAGQVCMDQYIVSNAYRDLLAELARAADTPRFEFTVEKNIKHNSIIDGIPFLGKPDVYFRTKGGLPIIYDFKVNGYCGKRPTSPKQGYVTCRDGWTAETAKASRGGSGNTHKRCLIEYKHGIRYNANPELTLAQVDAKWALQLCIYSWLMGTDVGEEMLTGIEQLACKPGTSTPLVRVASHRSLISPEFQSDVLDQAAAMWNIIQSGHIFDWMPREESDGECDVLDHVYKVHEDTGDDFDKWFSDNTRASRPY